MRLPWAFDKQYVTPGDALLDKSHLIKFCGNKLRSICACEVTETVFKPTRNVLRLHANSKQSLFATSDRRAFD